MCGINGFNFKDKELIEKMNKKIQHRGPDNEGFYEDEFDATVDFARENGLIDCDTAPHQGTDGKRAIFLNKEQTKGVVIEITGP